MVGHVLDQLRDPATEIALAGDQLAVHQLLVGDLDAVVAGDRDGLFVGEAAFDLLLAARPSLMTGLNMTCCTSFSST